MKIVAIIPVKSTSTRIKNKNIRLLGDKPLFLHTLEKLLSIDKINEVWIDTDDLSIIKIAENYNYKNFKFFIRSKEFASNQTNGNTLLQNEINNIDADIYLQILCTSPFTKISNIISCINLLKTNKSVVGCFKEKMYLWNNHGPIYDKNNIPNSNDLSDTIIESMSLYGIHKEEFLKTQLRIGSNPYILKLDGDEMIDINYESEFVLANKLKTLEIYKENAVYNNIKLQLNSCIIADILNDMGYNNYVLQGFKLNMNNNKLFGRVRPIQIRKLKENEEPNTIYNCLESYNNILPGNIIFVNNKVDRAYFGDLNATIAITKQAQGTIINGYTRDICRTIEINYPTFYKNNTCNDVKNFGTLDYYDEPICVNGIMIYVNNLIFADIDGIVIIPKEIESIVINKCIEVISKEKNISSSILSGNQLNNIINNFGLF